MFKLPAQIPTPEDSIEVLADYLEFECIKDGNVAILGKINQLLLQNDEILIEGVEDETDEALAKIEAIAQEIQRRQEISRYQYPFVLSNNGYTLTVRRDKLAYWVYVYLLLSTRLNMNTHKVWNHIDGTEILEQLSAIVAQNYFGTRSQSLVFGTAAAGGFEKKINDLCQKIGEGKKFEKRDKLPITQKDDRLDVVVWTDFTDKRWSKLIGFGQCKTGTTFDDQATIELQPDQFCQKWFLDSPVVAPVKMFFCSQYYPLDTYSKSTNAGLVFDRMRIMDFLPAQIDLNLEKKIVSWCTAAIDFVNKYPNL
ncbi:MAG: hypothetical protein EAZ70_00130 [Runella slithyformis]|nr:MAG: hypothetical protein EAY79_00525 [Runella slithyformis]TAF29956.1 MAG: hypothetical protein EAZ70_00130 [Runella slithyformis]TAF49072.1 MAG: hypothetical protein EAZ63_02195 [Runella slithyformis]TAF83567.1 MAG: hypothetical protein EAZ50_00285 [Runella slithyformis]